MEGNVAAVAGGVAMGSSPADARRAIRMVMLSTTCRCLAVDTGFIFPASSKSGVT
jgi:hypothetical protein